MKKVFLILSLCFFFTMNLIPVHANEISFNELDKYTSILSEINSLYGTDLHIYNSSEYYENSLNTLFSKDYESYMQYILSYDEKEFYDYCMSIINVEENIDTNIDENYTRSTSASKSVLFNNNRNKMTLKYKYTTSSSVKYFDTSYKPTATVTKIANIDYFQMSSYSGKFTNSNKSYTVTAKGKIITNVGMVDKTFSVKFNLN